MDMLDTGLESSSPESKVQIMQTIFGKSHEKEEETEEHIMAGDVVYHIDGVDEQTAAIASVTGAGNLTLDPSMFQLRADSNNQGGVTYRVVQVSSEGDTTAQVMTGTFPSSQVTVIQSPFSNGGSPTPDQQAEAPRYYFSPTTVATEAAGATQQGETIAAATALTPVATGAGPFYVMMSPQDVLNNSQRTIAPRTAYSPKLEGRSSRDDRRRATHNEVERRRRDKINNWIVQLSKLVPDCVQETKPNQAVSAASKGGILSKACEYIQELRNSNNKMMDNMKDADKINVDAELLRSQVEELKKQNEALRQMLIQHNIPVPPNLQPDLV